MKNKTREIYVYMLYYSKGVWIKMNKLIKQLFICFTILLSSISFYSCNKQDTYYESYTFEYGIDFHMIESNSIDFVESKLDRYGNYGYKTGHPYFMSNWLPSITKYFDYEDYKCLDEEDN